VKPELSGFSTFEVVGERPPACRLPLLFPRLDGTGTLTPTTFVAPLSSFKPSAPRSTLIGLDSKSILTERLVMSSDFIPTALERIASLALTVSPAMAYRTGKVKQKDTGASLPLE